MDSHDPPAPTAASVDGHTDALPGGDRHTWRPAAHVIRICKLESCQTDGDRELQQDLEARLAIGVDERTADGSISFEALECAGLCDLKQAVSIDGQPVVGRGAVLRGVDDLLG